MKVECRYCGKEFDSNEKRCPFCGAVNSDYFESFQNEDNENNESKIDYTIQTQSLKKLKKLIFIIALIFFIIPFCFMALNIGIFAFLYNRTQSDFVLEAPTYLYLGEDKLYYCEEVSTQGWWKYNFKTQDWEYYDGIFFDESPLDIVPSWLLGNLEKKVYKDISDDLLKQINSNLKKSFNKDDLLFFSSYSSIDG